MSALSHFGFAALALVALAAAPAARADDSDAAGLQSVSEMMRQDAIRNSRTGWSNGETRLVGSGTGSPGLTYSGTPQGGVGRSGVASFAGNGGGNPIVSYAADSTSGVMLVKDR